MNRAERRRLQKNEPKKWEKIQLESATKLAIIAGALAVRFKMSKIFPLEHREDNFVVSVFEYIDKIGKHELTKEEQELFDYMMGTKIEEV